MNVLPGNLLRSGFKSVNVLYNLKTFIFIAAIICTLGLPLIVLSLFKKTRNLVFQYYKNAF